MNPPVEKLGMVLKRHDPRVRDVVADVIPWLQSHGVEIFLDQAPALPQPVSLNVVPPQELVSKVDVVAVFGGDGTLLYAARIVADSGVPILGVNLDRLVSSPRSSWKKCIRLSRVCSPGSTSSKTGCC